MGKRIIKMIVFVIAVLSFSFILNSSHLKFTPVSVSEGPLLFYVEPERVAECERYEVLFVIDPEISLKERKIFRINGNFRILYRIDRNRILVHVLTSIDGGLFIAHLNIGKSEQLSSGGSERILYQEGNRLIFLNTIESENKLFFVDLGSSSSPEIISDKIIVPVLDIGDEKIWYIADSDGVLELFQYDILDNKNIRLITLPRCFRSPGPICEISPNGQYVALGIREMEYYERCLVVMDLDSGQMIFEQPDILVKTQIGCSIQPQLQFSWINNDEIRYSESVINNKSSGFFQWVDINIKTKNKTGKAWYAPLGCWHQNPSENIPFPNSNMIYRNSNMIYRETKGNFIIVDWCHIYIKGSDILMGNICGSNGMIDSSEISVSPCGNWAAYMYSEEGLFVIDGLGKEKIHITPKCSYDLVWLPGCD